MEDKDASSFVVVEGGITSGTTTAGVVCVVVVIVANREDGEDAGKRDEVLRGEGEVAGEILPSVVRELTVGGLLGVTIVVVAV